MPSHAFCRPYTPPVLGLGIALNRQVQVAVATEIEALESRRLLSLAPSPVAGESLAEVQQKWDSAGSAFFADLNRAEALNPTFAERIQPLLQEYGLYDPAAQTIGSGNAPSSAALGSKRLPRRHMGSRQPASVINIKFDPRHGRRHHGHPTAHVMRHHPHGKGGGFGSGDPYVTDAVYNFSQSPHQLTFTFNTAMNADSWSSAVAVINLNTGSAIGTTPDPQPSGYTTAVTLDIGGSYLDDGDANFVAILHGAQIHDQNGDLLNGTDGVAGHDYMFALSPDTTPPPPQGDFWFKDADIVRDRTVNFTDLNTLAQHYGHPGTYSQGDLNYSGTIDFTDLNTLAQHYNQVLPALGTPTGFGVTGYSDSAMLLNWSWPSDGSVTSFDVYRNGQLAATGVTDTTYIDTGLSPVTNYNYFVVSRDQSGNSSYPTPELIGETYLLATPSDLTAVPASTSEIDLSWTDNAVGATGVEIWRSLDGANYGLLTTLPPSAASFADTGLAESTLYFCQVRAVSAAGTSAFAATQMVTLPAAPTSLTATTSNGNVELSWIDNSQNEDGFEIFRSTDGANFDMANSVGPDTATFEDTEAPEGQTDYYEVVALDTGGASAASNVVSAMPVGSVQATDDPTPPPGSPTGSYQVVHGQTLAISAAELLSNDVDLNGRSPGIGSYTQPSHGTLTYDTNQATFTYAADAGYMGADSFSYTPTDALNAPASAATVNILVTDDAPEAFGLGDELPVVQAADANGNWLGYPEPDPGRLDVSDQNGDALTYSASIIVGQGSFSLDPNTGDFTFTPSQSYTGPVTITFTANDGILTSNVARLVFPGWKFGEEDSDTQDPLDGDEVQPAANLPSAPFDPNASYGMVENGTLVVNAPGVLGYAIDSDDPSTDSDSLSVGSLIESPRHGSVTIDSNSGSFTYVPDSDFVGRDWFTCIINDGAKQGGSATIFVDVQPVNVSLQVLDLTPGDSYAQIPQDSTTTLLNLFYPTWLPSGSTITLSIPSGQADVDVYDGDVILGADGSASKTWTVGSDVIPSSVYVKGLHAGSVQFALAAAVPATNVAVSGLYTGTAPGPATTQAAQPVAVKVPPPVIIGFFGANGPGPLNIGNQELVKIANDVGAVAAGSGDRLRLFPELARDSAFRTLLNNLDTNRDGKYDPWHPIKRNGQELAPDTLRSIRIFGHSWGGYTAVQLAMQISNSRAFAADNTIELLATIDPVSTLRILQPVSVPSNVSTYWNRYRSKGGSVSVMGLVFPHGIYINSNATITDEEDLNPDGQQKTKHYLEDGRGVVIDHFRIIYEVESELEGILIEGPS